MNSRTGQVGRDSSFNSLLRVLSPVQSRSELIRPEAELVAYKIEVLFGLQSRSELIRPEAELVAYKIEVLFGLQL